MAPSEDFQLIGSPIWEYRFVDVFGEAKAGKFQKKHPPSRKSLGRFLRIVRAAAWANLDALKQTFASADYTAKTGSVIFNVGGGKYRVVARVDFTEQILTIDQVLTHAEYDERSF